jgi:hypothetical protein
MIYLFNCDLKKKLIKNSTLYTVETSLETLRETTWSPKENPEMLTISILT